MPMGTALREREREREGGGGALGVPCGHTAPPLYILGGSTFRCAGGNCLFPANLLVFLAPPQKEGARGASGEQGEGNPARGERVLKGDETAVVCKNPVYFPPLRTHTLHESVVGGTVGESCQARWAGTPVLKQCESFGAVFLEQGTPSRRGPTVPSFLTPLFLPFLSRTKQMFPSRAAAFTAGESVRDYRGGRERELGGEGAQIRANVPARAPRWHVHTSMATQFSLRAPIHDNDPAHPPQSRSCWLP